MSPKLGLLQMTGVVVDILQKVERLPRPGEEIAARSRASAPAAASTRWRRRGGRGGRGLWRDAGARRLRRYRPRGARRRGGGGGAGPDGEVDQGFCVVLVQADGERAYVYNPGAERMASAADLAGLPAGDFAWVLLGGYAAPEPPGGRVRRLAGGAAGGRAADVRPDAAGAEPAAFALGAGAGSRRLDQRQRKRGAGADGVCAAGGRGDAGAGASGRCEHGLKRVRERAGYYSLPPQEFSYARSEEVLLIYDGHAQWFSWFGYHRNLSYTAAKRLLDVTE